MEGMSRGAQQTPPQHKALRFVRAVAFVCLTLITVQANAQLGPGFEPPPPPPTFHPPADPAPAAVATECKFDLKVTEFLMSDSTLQLRTQSESSAAAVGTYAAGIAGAGITTYVILWLLAFASGGSGGTLTELIIWWARAMAFTLIAGTASYYNHYVAEVFWDAPGEIAQAVAQGKFNAASLTRDVEGRINLGSALDQVASKGVCSALGLWNATVSWRHPVDALGYFGAGLTIILVTVVFVAIAAGLAFISYVALSVVLALGPLFVLAAIWQATKPMFESFLRTAINYALHGVVLMIMVGLAIGLMQSFATSAIGTPAGDKGLMQATMLVVRMLFAFAIGIALLLKADDLSASLVGGISLGAGGMAGAAGGVLGGGVKGAIGGAKAAANPGKTAGEFMGGSFHRNPSTGDVTYKSAGQGRKDHSAAMRAARSSNGVQKKG